MSVRRALVECAVLSVQDGRVFYPCCKGCFSRIDVDQHDTTRYRCCKCGYICMKEQVDYRYRLSLKVTRGRCIFGVTVFGTCLDQFFGIHASGLQRLVEDMDGPVGASTRATLLMKAVKDCFIGRHFIFGIKMTSTESGLFVGEPVTNGSSCKDTVQFVTSQMILPTAASLRGCTVVSYYRILLQKAAEYEQGSTDSGKNPGNPETALLLIAHQSPASSFNNTTLSTAGLLCLSPQRSHHHESTLTPTPPWQQSLGLITSSAEQEEGCSTQVSGEENSRLTDNKKTSQYARRSFLESHKVTRERTLSPLLSLEHSSYRSPLFAKYPQMSSEKDGKNTAVLNTCFSPSKPVHKGDLPLSCEVREFSSRQLTNSSLSSSLAWENLPFSESLSEFLCEDQDYDIVGETEPHLNVQNQNETLGNNVEIKSQNSNFQFESIFVSNSNTQMTEINPRILLNITNTPALTKEDNTHGLSDQLCKNSGECQSKSKVRSFCFHPSEQDSTEDTSLSSENKEEEQLEVDKYDCSADLFSCSTVSNMKTETLNEHEETVSFTEGSPRISSLHKQQMSEKASTPGKERLKSNKCINRDSLISPGKEDLDFIPPAQSTPIVKVALVSGPPVFSCSSSPSGALSPQSDGQDLCTTYDQPELDSKRLTKTTPSICKLNSENRHDHKSTPKRFWKPNRHKNHPLDYQHPRVQTGSLHLGSKVRTKHKIDSSICDVTLCDYEDNEVIVPPTPAKTRLSVKRRRREEIGNRSNDLDSPWKMQQEHEVNCKRNMLDQHLSSLTSSQSGMAQTGNCDSEVACDGSLNGSNGCLFDDENQACDWSRDLFSNSI